MNILPLVSVLLFALVLMTKVLIQEKVSNYWEEVSLSGFMNAQRSVLNKKELKNYQLATKVPDPANKQKAKDKKKKEIKHRPDAVYESHREARDLHDAARLNIQALFAETKSPLYDRIYATASNLITLLYGHAPFFKEAKQAMPDLEKRLLDALIEKAKKVGKFQKLADLCPEDLLLRPVFQKMIQGTNRYYLNERRGYPSMATYFTFEEKRKPILFCFASKQLLEAFFDPTLASEIMAKERKKWEKDHKHRVVTEKEFKALLQRHPQLAFKLPELADYFSFSNRSGARASILGHDAKSGINVKVSDQ
jgi:hypothetical protein